MPLDPNRFSKAAIHNNLSAAIQLLEFAIESDRDMYSREELAAITGRLKRYHHGFAPGPPAWLANLGDAITKGLGETSSTGRVYVTDTGGMASSAEGEHVDATDNSLAAVIRRIPSELDLRPIRRKFLAYLMAENMKVVESLDIPEPAKTAILKAIDRVRIMHAKAALALAPAGLDELNECMKHRHETDAGLRAGCSWTVLMALKSAKISTDYLLNHCAVQSAAVNAAEADRDTANLNSSDTMQSQIWARYRDELIRLIDIHCLSQAATQP